MMHIPLTEPVSPRYIHINPVTNKVHLLVPVVGGQEISTDNTCKATVALREFFDGSALSELKAYKDKLVFDIGLFNTGSPQRVLKEARLKQIEAYINAIPAMQYRYANAIKELLARPSNLYSIQLRPREPDYQSNVFNPVFNIERGTNRHGEPLSPLYRAMYDTFPTIVIENQNPQALLTNAVLTALPHSFGFEDIQRVLQEECNSLFGVKVDFTKSADGTLVTKAYIDVVMGLDDETSPEAYIPSLLGACASNLWVNIPTPPFYSISVNTTVEERTEGLSILTQFFLANLNVYCKAKGISWHNFGVILDTNQQLSADLVIAVSQALAMGTDVEQTLCNFCNTYSAEFGLVHSLSESDVNSVKQKFLRNWRTISTGENAHMDDFMILDMEATKERSQFVTHQGAICVDFANIASLDILNQAFFREVREDFKDHLVEIPNGNQFIAGVLDIEPEVLLERINDDQLEKLPAQVKEACRTHPSFQLRHFLHCIAKGKQQEAQLLLEDPNIGNIQNLMRSKCVFTDFSGRTFNCTAYEYAYWAKDTHMCRMLESYMDERTKAHMLACITEIERIDGNTREKTGLEYQQYGRTYRSANFDFIPLIKALQKYVREYDEMAGDRSGRLIESACMALSTEQRNAPAHVVQEYCRQDRTFDSNPQFKEATLPRDLTFYNLITGKNESWFPLGTNSGVALMRGKLGIGAAADTRMNGDTAALDMKAIINLNRVRIADLKQSRENLSPMMVETPRFDRRI